MVIASAIHFQYMSFRLLRQEEQKNVSIEIFQVMLRLIVSFMHIMLFNNIWGFNLKLNFAMNFVMINWTYGLIVYNYV